MDGKSRLPQGFGQTTNLVHSPGAHRLHPMGHNPESRNFSFPAVRFCGKMLTWENDAKRASAQSNFCFSTT
jgi:hypothetical protein